MPKDKPAAVSARKPPSTSQSADLGRPLYGWRLRLYTVIFEADTRAGKAFDVGLIVLVLLSVLLVMLESVVALQARYGRYFDLLEYLFTALFTAEYIARLVCVRHPLRYAMSFYGLVDLLAVLPTYLALFVPELYALVDVRVLRLLRIFRIFKLGAYLAEVAMLAQALKASARKIQVFLTVVMMAVIIMGTVMYLIEGPANGFTSIPTSIYWAITTMTTVGFGDITPKTDLGRAIASLMMLLGWGVLAVPTGIVTAEMTLHRAGRTPSTRRCPECLSEGHGADARYCRDCGARLPPHQREPGV